MSWPKYDAQKESQIIEKIPCFARVFAPESTTIFERPNTPITPYENMKRILEGQTPCWLPGDADMYRFSPRLMFENEVRAFVMDADPKSTLQFGGKDYFGIEWRLALWLSAAIRPSRILIRGRMLFNSLILQNGIGKGVQRKTHRT